MGSSSEAKGIDASVGGLVWVRRRNGSWWPGKILGLDELSESCLVSPRSGTPVKLLGREDASIDWYNLEKSKRVKAFRCGEYDECIEKAKASAANSSKKVVKYARREDAILHALELESAHLGKEQMDFSYTARKNDSDGEQAVSASESPPVSDSSGEDGAVSDDVSKSEDPCQNKGNSEVSSDSAPEFSLSDVHLEEPNNADCSKALSGQNRRRTPNDSEDDGSEGVKRMRGLEDLGVCLMANRKSDGGEQLEVVQQEDSTFCEPNPGNRATNGNPSNVNTYSSSLRRKRSQVASVQEFLKRKNRRRPLTKVLESTAMVSVPVICDQLPGARSSPVWGTSEGRLSGLETESKKSNSLAAINGADGATVSCDNEASLNASEGSQINCKVKENEVNSSLSGFPENNSSDKLFDVPFIGEEKDSTGFSPSNASNQSTPAVSLGTEVIGEPGCTSLSAAQNDYINQRIEGSTSKWQQKGKRNSRNLSNCRKQDSRKYLSVDYASSYSCNLLAKSKKLAEGQVNGLCDWSKDRSYRKPHLNEQKAEAKQSFDGSLPPQKLLPYRQSRFATAHSRYQMPEFRNCISDSRLYDVELEVKASYRPQHVPLVSLMSKLNGKAIVGHPLTIEIVDEGFCDSLLSKIGSDLEADEHGCAVKNTKPARIQSSFSPNKSPKTKKSGQLCKKIRKLSSLTGHNRHQNEPKQTVEKSNGHVIACIPLKVVFSRINEAVSGVSRPSHHALTKAIP